MTRRLVESLSGVGAIHAGERLLRMTSYELSVWSNDEQAPEDRKTLPTIDGRIDITGIGEAVVLAGAEALILTIEDGRRLVVKLTSSSGTISSQGWLPGA